MVIPCDIIADSLDLGNSYYPGLGNRLLNLSLMITITTHDIFQYFLLAIIYYLNQCSFLVHQNQTAVLKKLLSERALFGVNIMLAEVLLNSHMSTTRYSRRVKIEESVLFENLVYLVGILFIFHEGQYKFVGHFLMYFC